MKAEEFIKSKKLNLNVTINGAIVPIKELGTDMYNLMEEYAEHQMKEYAEFCIECDRAGLPILEPNDYINKLK